MIRETRRYVNRKLGREAQWAPAAILVPHPVPSGITIWVDGTDITNNVTALTTAFKVTSRTAAQV